jgi:hypothetical protein
MDARSLVMRMARSASVLNRSATAAAAVVPAFAAAASSTSIAAPLHKTTTSMMMMPTYLSTSRFMSTAATAARPGQYQDKVVIVTGGSRGIGEGIVRTFAREGAFVVYCGLGIHADLGKKLESELNAKHKSTTPGKPTVMFLECDVTSSTSMDALVASTVKTYGR